MLTISPRQTDEVLPEQSEWLRVTLASIGDGVITCDNSGHVTFLNPVAAALTGWTQDEAAGVPLEIVFRIINEETRRTVENPATRAVREGVVVGLANHTILIGKDGAERFIDDSAAPIRSKTGEVIGCVLIFRDVTERRAAEIAQTERSRLVALRADVSTALNASQPVQAGLQGCCEALVQHLGIAFARIWTHDEAEGVLELQASAGQHTHLDGPHSRIKVGEFKIGRIAASRRPHLNNDVPNDPNVSDQAWARREGMVAFAGYPLLVEGRVVGVLAMFARQPLTEGILADLAPLADQIAQHLHRKRAEAALRASESRFRLLDALGEATRNVAEPEAVMMAAARLLGEHLHVTRCAYADVEPDNDSFTIRDDWTVAGATTTAGTYSLDLFGPRAAADMRTGRNLVVRDVDAELTGGGAEMFNAIGIKAIICCPLVKDGQLRAMMAVHSATPRDWTSDEVMLVREVAERSWAHIERVRSAAVLRTSEERFRLLFDTMDEGFCLIEMIFDDAGRAIDYRFLETNASFARQCGLVDAVGKTMREMVPNHNAHWFEIYGKVATTGEPARFEDRGEAMGGWWWDVYAFRLGGPGSRKVAVLFNDITARKKAEQDRERLLGELKEQDRRKDEFLAMLSHELRSPLAPISNAVQLLRHQGDEDPVQQQARSIIERQVGQLKHLIDDLLEVSRITTGRVQLRQERIAVSGIVERAVETARPLIAQRRHELTVTLPPQPIWLHADAARLEQVVVNLLTNAAKYTDEGGRIWLTVKQEDQEAVLRVRDTGVGIAPELLPHIFDLFTQAERSLARSEGGLGIGLALVERLVKLHGGRVEAISALGLGSEFIVRLPVIVSPAAPIAPSTAPIQPTGKYCRVLVVDDNVDSAESLAMLLRMSKHDVRTAHDGLAALETALDYRPDVVLLDIGLPKLDGYEVARKLRQQPPFKNVVLVAMTGYGQESDRQHSHEAGFDHHLVKPADFGKVKQILASVSEKAT